MNDEGAAPEPAPAGFAGLANAIGTRNLMIAIIAMPVVFLAAIGGTLAIFGRPDTNKKEAVRAEAADASLVGSLTRSPAGPTVAAANAEPIEIAGGAEISAMALDGDRIALRVSGPAGGEIVVYDIARGAVIRRVPVVEGGQ